MNENSPHRPLDFELNHPLQIAEQLEQNHGKPSQGMQEVSLEPEIPEDFQTALHGLNLIRRAAQADRRRSNDRTSLTHTSSETYPQAQADTDRIGRSRSEHQDVHKICDSRTTEHHFGSAAERFSADLQRIGRFEIIRELGRGGFGVVLLGRDPELDRQVAVKVPRLEMLIDPESKQRFAREANLVSTLSHPAIIPIYEYSAGPGVPFIAFAWCQGPSLADWMRQLSAPLAPRLAAKLIAQLAGAMQYAHQRGVVHRDLKPANVLLNLEPSALTGPVDEEVFVASLRITDFGLAKSLQPSTTNLTHDGAIVGTPNYMAPEQVVGRSEIAPAVDIYSLGAMLYELLTGQPPFNRDSDLATLRAIEQDDPLRPGKLCNAVTADLEAVCLKCLEKNPAHRYQSSHALQQDLENFVAGRAVTARPVSSLERFTRWCRRNPLAASLAGSTLLASSVALIASLFGWYTTHQALDRERLAYIRADRSHRDAKSAIDSYFVTVSEDHLLSAVGLKPLRQKLLRSAVDYYSDFVVRHQDDPHLAQELIQAILYRAAVDDELGDYPAAREGYETVWRMLKESQTEESADLLFKQQAAAVLRKLARLDRLAGQANGALEKINQAIALNQELLLAGQDSARTHGELGQLLSQLANLQLSSGKLKQAIETHLTSERHFKQATDLEPENSQWEHFLTQSRGNQAHFYQQTGDPDKAIQRFDQVATRLSHLIERHPEHLQYQADRGKALAALSLSQRAIGKQEAGLSSLQEATRIFDHLAAVHPQVVMYQSFRATSRREIAEILNNLDRLDECETTLLMACEILSQLRKETAVNRLIQNEVNFVHLGLGRLYQRLNNPIQAHEHLQIAVSSLEQEYLEMPGNFSVACGLAEALLQMAMVAEDQPEAIRLLDRGQVILETVQKDRPDNRQLFGMLQVNRETRRMLEESFAR